MHIWKSQRGSAVLMAVMALMMLGGMGATTIAIVSSDETGKATALATDQAFGLAQAGVEFAKNRIDLGLSPIVANYPMGSGVFTVAAAGNAGALTSTGTVGNTQKTFNLTTAFGKDCLDLETTSAHVAANNIVGARLVKSCLTQNTITDWTIAWAPDNGERTVKLQIRGSPTITVYDDRQGYVSGTKISATDYSIMANNIPIPINKIEYANTLPHGKTYTITAHLSDGSSVTRSFTDTSPGIGGGSGGGSDSGEGSGGGDAPVADTTPGYEVEDSGDVSIEPERNVTVQALCSEITYGANGPTIPVKAWLGSNGAFQNLWGGQAIQGGEIYSTTSGAVGMHYTIKANAQYRKRRRTYFNSTYTSNNVKQVKTLINGNTAPPLAGFGGQKPISECVANYISSQTGRVTLEPNQVILLFEMGVDMQRYPTSRAADFQDLVVLLTID